MERVINNKRYYPIPSSKGVQVYAGRSLQNTERSEKALLNHGYVGSFIIAR